MHWDGLWKCMRVRVEGGHVFLIWEIEDMMSHPFHLQRRGVLVVCAGLIPCAAPQGDGQASPLTDMI